MPYLYQSSAGRPGEYTQIIIQKDDGTETTLRQGRTYDLSTNELLRASKYAVMVHVTSAADDVAVGINRLPILGAPSDGQVPVWSESAGAFVPRTNTTQRYIGIYFGGDDTLGQKLFLAASGDGVTFRPRGGPTKINGAGQSRDQDVIYYGGRYWCVYTKTPAFLTVSTAFGLSVSDDLETWTQLDDVSCTGLSGVQRVWGPTWYLDGSILRVFVACTTTNSDQGPFKVYELHPTDSLMSAWSNPLDVSAGLPTSVFDFNIFQKIGATYVALYKDNVTEYVCRATSSSALGPWTVTDSGDWMGDAAAFGVTPAAAEAPWVFPLPDGSYGRTFDRYRVPGSPDAMESSTPPQYRKARSYFSRTTDPTLRTGWSAPVQVKQLGRHPRIRKMPLPDGWLDSFVKPQVEVVRVATYAIPVAPTVSAIPWSQANEDTDGMWNSAYATDLITVRTGGSYTVEAQNVFLTAASGNVFAGIWFNEDFQPGTTDKRTGAGFDPAVSMSLPRRLSSGDRVGFVVQTDAARNSGTVPFPYLRARWEGP